MSTQDQLPDRCNNCLLFIQHKIASFSFISRFNINEMVVAVSGAVYFEFWEQTDIKARV